MQPVHLFAGIVGVVIIGIVALLGWGHVITGPECLGFISTTTGLVLGGGAVVLGGLAAPPPPSPNAAPTER